MLREVLINWTRCQQAGPRAPKGQRFEDGLGAYKEDTTEEG